MRENRSKIGFFNENEGPANFVVDGLSTSKFPVALSKSENCSFPDSFLGSICKLNLFLEDRLLTATTAKAPSKTKPKVPKEIPNCCPDDKYPTVVKKFFRRNRTLG